MSVCKSVFFCWINGSVLSILFCTFCFSLNTSLLDLTVVITSVCVLVAQSCPTLCNPVDCSPPGSSVHGISQARILEWVAISYSRGSSQARDQTRISCVSCIGRRILSSGSWDQRCRGKKMGHCGIEWNSAESNPSDPGTTSTLLSWCSDWKL